MPELPEVETVMRGLARVMTGVRLAAVEQRRPDLRWPFPPDFAARLTGRTITGMSRRAKYILAELDDGMVWIAHLGMSGRFTIAEPAAGSVTGAVAVTQPGSFVHATDSGAPGSGAVHDHVVMTLSSGTVITYNDPRRFGCMDLVALAGLDQHRLMAGLGPEPLSDAFNARHLASRARGRSVDLKALLMDQRVVAGLGNIYVCEALWRAGLLPERAAATLAAGPKAQQRATALVDAAREVLAEAIAAGGSSLRDYRQASGDPGAFQTAHAVYDREDQPCLKPGCTGTIRRIVQTGRSTWFCPRCQR